MRILFIFFILSALAAENIDITKLKLVANTPPAQKTAQYLSSKLEKIYGIPFTVESGDGETGIAVGTVTDFPDISFKVDFLQGHPGERQGFAIKTHDKGIYLIGASQQGTDYAVGELLHQIGYRFYFPVDKWEIFPDKPVRKLDLDIRETPDYYTRNIRPGWGIWPDMRGNNQDNARWLLHNRVPGKDLRCNHSYGEFIRRNKKEFEVHPEYYALYRGERTSDKLCIANTGLRNLICDYAITVFRKNPQRESFSVDPSDGGGWCECQECAKLGSPSNRAVILANAVAEAVNTEFPGKTIGMYAYNLHSPPPSIRVHSQVVVCIATSFIRDGWSVNKLIEGWRRQGAVVGIREYYYAGLPPGQGMGTNLDYLAASIPAFLNKGVRFMIAEAPDSWATGGLGYYLAARLLWNIKADLEQIKTDFLENAFPRSKVEMRQFYQLLDGGRRRPLSADLLGRMYRILEKARRLTVDENERARVDALVYYTRIAELQFLYETATTVENYERLYSFIASVRKERLVHSYSMSRDSRQMIRPQLKGKKLPLINWMDTRPPITGDAERFIREGIEKYQLLDFTLIAYSNDLRLITLDGENQTGNFGTTRGLRVFYIWCDGGPITLQITGGLIKHYRNRGNVRLQLIQIGGPSDAGTLETLIQEDASVPPDGETRQVALTPKYPGLHRLTIDDGMDMSRIEWPVNLPVVMPVEQESAPEFSGTFYFYVPVNTRKLGFYAKIRRGKLIAPNGKEIYDLQKTNGFYSLPVPPEHAGKVWSIRNAAGVIRLLTVPSGLSLNSKFLLIPNEIIKDEK